MPPKLKHDFNAIKNQHPPILIAPLKSHRFNHHDRITSPMDFKYSGPLNNLRLTATRYQGLPYFLMDEPSRQQNSCKLINSNNVNMDVGEKEEENLLSLAAICIYKNWNSSFTICAKQHRLLLLRSHYSTQTHFYCAYPRGIIHKATILAPQTPSPPPLLDRPPLKP